MLLILLESKNKFKNSGLTEFIASEHKFKAHTPNKTYKSQNSYSSGKKFVNNQNSSNEKTRDQTHFSTEHKVIITSVKDSEHD